MYELCKPVTAPFGIGLLNDKQYLSDHASGRVIASDVQADFLYPHRIFLVR